MITEATIRLSAVDLDFDKLLTKGWAHPKSPSNAYQNTLVKEMDGLDIYIVQRGDSYQVGFQSRDPHEAFKVMCALYRELA